MSLYCLGQKKGCRPPLLQVLVEEFAKLARTLHRLGAELAGTKTKRESGQVLGSVRTPDCEQMRP